MLDNHPLRERVVQEMLLRRFPAIEAPARIVQIVRIVDPADRAAETMRVAAMPDADTIDGGERHVAGLSRTGTTMLWERHSEASTATLLLAGEAADEAAMAWVEGLPGRVVRAIEIGIAADEAAAQPAIEAACLDGSDLVTCHVGKCRIWSDFRMSPDGYGRIVIAANRCPPADLGRIVQRLQELGNYRNLALLGLPMAQLHAGRLDALETLLADHAQAIAAVDGDDEALLDRLSDLSAELAHISALTAFRMGATHAYAAIVADRLASLAVAPIAGHQSLADFNDRRLVPAVRTCANFSARLETLGGRAARVTALLRTRIETRIERQNRDLLRSVERGIGLQIRLQHLVESLSVLAISYYAVGLIAYLAKGAAKAIPSFSAELATAVAVIPVTVAIALFIRRRRDGLFARDDGHAA
jgi:uncharacterized membrane-anchored protein